MTTPSPFLTLQLLELALEADKACAYVANQPNNEQAWRSSFFVVTQAYRAVLAAVESEGAQWPAHYASQVLGLWEDAYNPPHRVSAHPAPAGGSVAESIELALMEAQAFPWYSPAGQPPNNADEGLIAERLARVKKSIRRQQHRWTDRLLDWPGAAQRYVEQEPFESYGQTLSHFPDGRTGWAGMLLNYDTSTIAIFLKHGAVMEPRDGQGRLTLAYTTQERIVEFFLKQGWDPLHQCEPFQQRCKDLRDLLAGWKQPLKRHLERPRGDSLDLFTSGFHYLKAALKAWTPEERATALLPIVSNGFLNQALSKFNTVDSLHNWAMTFLNTPNTATMAMWPVSESSQTWTFEQWCAVRFLRGHTPSRTKEHPVAHALARVFSKEKAVSRGQTTDDLHRLVNWIFHAPARPDDSGLRVPRARLLPLLQRVCEGDEEDHQTKRYRLHQLMAAALGDTQRQDGPEMGPLLVAYTRWVWRNPNPDAEVPQEHIVAWLTQSPHARALSPADRHFLAIHNLRPRQPLPAAREAEAWDFLAGAIAEGGEVSDEVTPTLPPQASGAIRASERYRTLVRSLNLERRLPQVRPSEEKHRKPRF